MPNIINVGEIGYSGTQIFSGRIKKDEWVGDLKGLEFFRKVDRMRTDSIISAIETGFFTAIQNGERNIDYEDDVEITPLKEIQLKFINEQVRKIKMDQFISNACLSIPYGFIPFENVFYKIKSGEFINKIGLKKLAPRLPKTVNHWIQIDTGDITGFVQDVYTQNAKKSQVTIEGQKFVIITHKLEGGDIEGRSEYRPIYREWMVKDETWKQLIFAIQRLGAGVPLVRMKDEATQQNVDYVEAVLKDLVANENTWLILKMVEEIIMWSPDKNTIDGMLAVIKQANEDIAKSTFQMYLSLGTSQSGSRAVGDTFADLFYNSLEGVAIEISDPFNDQVIKRLIDINWGPQDAYPKLSIKIKRDMSTVFTMLANLRKEGLIIGNDELENWVLEIVGAPQTTETNKLSPPVIQPAQIAQASQTAFSEKTKCNHKHIEMSENLISFNSELVGPLERNVLNLDEIVDNLNSLKKQMATELRNVIQPIMINAAQELGKGKKIYEVDINFGNKVADIYRKYQKKLNTIAENDVKNEIVKQNVKMSEIVFAEKKPVKKELPDYFEEFLKEQPNVESDFLRNKTKNDLSNYYQNALIEGLAAKDLSESIIKNIIDEVGQRYESGANKLLGGYAYAREIASEQFDEVITAKVRSEVLDKNTCPHCRTEHGHEYFYDENENKYFDKDGNLSIDLPDEDCDGKKLCRGIYIYTVE